MLINKLSITNVDVQMAEDFICNCKHPRSRIDGRVSEQNLLRNKHICYWCSSSLWQTRYIWHQDDSTADSSTNRGNFLAILEAFVGRDSVLKNRLESSHTNANTSKTIQNDVMDCIKQHNQKQSLRFFWVCWCSTNYNGHHLGQIIRNILEVHNRNLSYCVGQCYDGASSMSSLNFGCQTEVKTKPNLAIY